MFGTTMALGLVQIVIDGTYCAVVVLLASRVRRWLSRVAVRRRLERILATLIGLGMDLASAARCAQFAHARIPELRASVDSTIALVVGLG